MHYVATRIVDLAFPIIALAIAGVCALITLLGGHICMDEIQKIFQFLPDLAQLIVAAHARLVSAPAPTHAHDRAPS